MIAGSVWDVLSVVTAAVVILGQIWLEDDDVIQLRYYSRVWRWQPSLER